METTSSIFKLMHYRYLRANKSKLHYPRFRVYMNKEIYFKTLTEVEGYMQEVARRYTKYHLNDPYVDIYAYVAIEIPLDMEVSLSFYGDGLSVRIYRCDGTLWGKRLYARTYHSFSFSGEEYDYWGKRSLFLGREPEEIKFKPGDIVEILGYQGNGFWSEEEVNLAIIVKAPPTVDEVAVMRQKYLETHSGFDFFDYVQSTVFDRFLDTYEVISNSKIGIDHASTISVFEPTKKVSKRRQEALRDLYRKYSNQCEQHSAISD